MHTRGSEPNLRPNLRSSLRRAGCASAVAAALIVVAPPAGTLPFAAAAATRIESTDDGAGPGTCPAVNQWNQPTKGNCFKPESVTIRTGTTVTWENTGERPHDVVADDGSFRGGRQEPGDAWTYTFNAPGTFRYYCSLHGDPGGVGQAGILTVEGPPVRGNKGGPGPRPSVRSTPRGQATATMTPSTASGSPSPGSIAVEQTPGQSLPDGGQIQTRLEILTVVGSKKEIAAAPPKNGRPPSRGFPTGLAAGLVLGLLPTVAGRSHDARRGSARRHHPGVRP